MPLRTTRLLVWPFAVVALTLRVCGELWFKPVTWRIDPKGVAFLAWLAVLAGTLLLPIAVHAMATRKARRRPATWQVETAEHRFVAPASPRWLGPWAIVVGWLAGALVQTERVPGEDRARLVELPGIVALSIAVPVLVLGGIAAVLLRNRPLLTVDADGITSYGLVGRTSLRWDRLLPGGPLPPPRGAANLTVMLLPAVPGDPPGTWALPARRLHVDPGFLANTIRQYVEHPDHRTAVGTRTELDRLHATLT